MSLESRSLVPGPSPVKVAFQVWYVYLVTLVFSQTRGCLSECWSWILITKGDTSSPENVRPAPKGPQRQRVGVRNPPQTLASPLTTADELTALTYTVDKDCGPAAD